MAFDSTIVELGDIEIDELDRGEKITTEDTNGEKVVIRVEPESVRK